MRIVRSQLPSFFAALTFIFLSCCGLASAASVTATWDPNDETNIAGYHLSYGTASGTYSTTLDVTHGTSAVITGLREGLEYYFVVTAYNTSGQESAPSEEQTYFVPVPTPTPTPTPTATPRPSATPRPTPTPRPAPKPRPRPKPKSKPTPKPAPTPRRSRESASTPAPQLAPTKTLLNVSTRVDVESGDSVLIGGFIVTGELPKSVILRAIGPSLAAAGVKGVLADPVLELYDSTGALVAQNDNWTSVASDTVPDGLAPADPNESLIVKRLVPGAYTAVLRGANGSKGIGLFELYDLDAASSRVSNISTRGVVKADDGAMIAGFIIGGVDPTKVIVRAIGPSLRENGVAGALPNPTLELRDSDGSLIFSNDDWRSDQEQQLISSTIPPTNNEEAAIVATLPPGNYTATVRGVGDTTGVALVEVYNLESQQ